MVVYYIAHLKEVELRLCHLQCTRCMQGFCFPKGSIYVPQPSPKKSMQKYLTKKQTLPIIKKTYKELGSNVDVEGK